MSERAPANRDPPPPVGQVTYPTSRSTSHRRQHQTTSSHRGPTVPKPAPQPNIAEDPNSDEEAMVEESPMAPEVGGIYAPLLRIQYQREVENLGTVPLPKHIIGGLRDQVEFEQTRACHCQKSNCLKLYCECFAGGVYCTAYCNCSDCNNYSDGTLLSRQRINRYEAIKSCLERNPHSFRPDINAKPKPPPPRVTEEDVAPAVATLAATKSMKRGETGMTCTCAKSRCLKKYCECFRNDEYCSSTCKCQQCMNTPGNPTRDRIVGAARKKANKAAAAAQAAAEKAAAKASSAGGPKRQQVPERSAEPPEYVNYTRGDTTFPPSYYAVPMKLPEGKNSATLGFGQGLTLKKRKAEASTSGDAPSAFERAMATEEAVLARRRAEDDAKTGGTNGSTTNDKKRTRSSLQVEMEQHWNEETRDVLGTFQAMRQELLQRKQDAGLLGADIVLTREYSYYDLVGSAQLASVELELADVLTSVREAKEHAQERIAKEAKEGSRASGSSQQTEQGPSTAQRARIITEAAQDTAMMKELARIIRRRALEMSEHL